MITDIRTIPVGTELSADICIIGGGAAGITLAKSLIGRRMKVLLLESGGLDRDDEVQALAKGGQSGVPYFPLDESRYRLLGGSTYRWGARTTPLCDLDYAKRDHVPLSGWPFPRGELARFFEQAVDLVGSLPGFGYDASVYALTKTPPPAIDPSRLRHVAFQFGKTLLLGEAYRAALKSADNIDVMLYANAVGLSTDPSGRNLDRVDIRTLGGARYTARARIFVLASGGIENARILLASRIGNSSGFIGSCFMEHPTASAGVVKARDPQAAKDLFSPGLINGRLIETGWALSAEAQREARCLNAYGRIIANVNRDPTQALREILWNLQHRRLPLKLSWYDKNKWLMQRMGAVLSDPVSIIDNAIRHKIGKPKRFRIDSLQLELRCEQAPTRESRITLLSDVDAVGMPRAHLHWALGEAEHRTMRTAAKLIGAELERLGVGRLEPAPWIESDAVAWPDDLVGGHHHMGSTRMSADPKTGVVDANCRSHDVSNLYIAGSSVFPTSGFANPTATLLSLALRLSEHLVQRAERSEHVRVETHLQSAV